jgi:hypothetical protein
VSYETLVGLLAGRLGPYRLLDAPQCRGIRRRLYRLRLCPISRENPHG